MPATSVSWEHLIAGSTNQYKGVTVNAGGYCGGGGWNCNGCTGTISGAPPRSCTSRGPIFLDFVGTNQFDSIPACTAPSQQTCADASDEDYDTPLPGQNPIEPEQTPCEDLNSNTWPYLIQNISSATGVNFLHFHMAQHGGDFAVIAENTGLGSTVYHWNVAKQTFEPFQNLPTNGAKAFGFIGPVRDSRGTNGNSTLYFLGVANVQDFTIYKWDVTQQQFSFFKTLIFANGILDNTQPSAGDVTSDIEGFVLGGDRHFFTFALVLDSTPVQGTMLSDRTDSFIYELVLEEESGEIFTLFQSFPTIGCQDVEYFSFANRSFLGVVNQQRYTIDGYSGSTQSQILEYSPTLDTFVHFQHVSTIQGSFFEFFSIGTRHFLGYTGYEFADDPLNRAGAISYLFEWDGSGTGSFRGADGQNQEDAFQRIELRNDGLNAAHYSQYLDAGSMDFFSLQDGKEHFLIIGSGLMKQYAGNTNSIIYQWDGDMFVSYNTIESVQGIEYLKSFNVQEKVNGRQRTLLAVLPSSTSVTEIYSLESSATCRPPVKLACTSSCQLYKEMGAIQDGNYTLTIETPGYPNMKNLIDVYCSNMGSYVVTTVTKNSKGDAVFHALKHTFFTGDEVSFTNFPNLRSTYLIVEVSRGQTFTLRNYQVTGNEDFTDVTATAPAEEWLNLPNDIEQNYNRYGGYAPCNPSACNIPAATTVFHKVRLSVANPNEISFGNTRDLTFTSDPKSIGGAYHSGSSDSWARGFGKPIGSPSDCASRGSTAGQTEIDLRGTQFALKKTNKWNTVGWGAASSFSFMYDEAGPTGTAGGVKVNAGGWCGGAVFNCENIIRTRQNVLDCQDKYTSRPVKDRWRPLHLAYLGTPVLTRDAVCQVPGGIVAEDNGIVDSGGGSSSSPAPSSGSDGGGSSGDSPSPGANANAGESPAPTPLHVDPRCDGAGTDPMASSPTFPIHQQAAWSSAAAFDQDYSLVCYRDISVNKAKCIATKRVREGEDQLRVGTIVPGVGGAIVANSNVMAFTGKFDHLLFFEILNM